MTEPSTTTDNSLLELSATERDERGITPEDVRDALLDVIRHGSKAEKIVTDCEFSHLDFSYYDLDSENNHPIVFRNCTFENIDADHVDSKLSFLFEECVVAGLSLEQARFEDDIGFSETTFTGAVGAFEARFDRDVDFTDTTFEAPLEMDEATFSDDARFVGTTFEAEASFRGAAFSGTSNELEDHATFAGAVFEDEVNFRQTSFKCTTFRDATFGARAHFEAARFDGDVDFAGATFDGETDFDECVVEEDVSFEECEFRESAVFRGAAFEGGASSRQDDVRFVNTVFHRDANFRDTTFRHVNFDGVAFCGHAMFEETRYEADADFTDVVFEDEADFDEARFTEDTDFSGSRFERPAVFRGAEFRGGAQHIEENATFEGVCFDDDVDFDNTTFTSANFTNTRFGGIIDFTSVAFTDSLSFMAESIDTDTAVNFTDASLKEGTIIQPENGRVRYDFTNASIGNVVFDAIAGSDRHDLLDYVRFCNTQFDEFDGYEFDFAHYTQYLDRHDWALHRFEEHAADYEYALDMTPEVVETTYLKAKNAASEAGQIKAAGEFRIKRQQFARKKHLAIVRDTDVSTSTQVKNASRAVENYFLGITCGHGIRLVRIGIVFLIAPIFPAFLYAFGGSAFRTSLGQLSSLGALTTPAGLATFYELVSFSYITFLTIGYGGISPVGPLARLLAGLEVYLSIILGGLVLYSLIKRSEV